MDAWEIFLRLAIPGLLGALAIWVGITRIPWKPPRDDD